MGDRSVSDLWIWLAAMGLAISTPAGRPEIVPGEFAGQVAAGAASTDAGTSPDAGHTPSAGSWLSVVGNRIYTPDGQVWHARGANIHDTRSCDACTWGPPNVAEVKRRVDELVGWGANFLRLDLESYAQTGGRTHGLSVLQDPAYLADIEEIVAHVGTKPGVRLMVSLWVDPSFTSMGWPSAATADTWRKLAETFKHDSHVLFGVSNEPQANFNGAYDPQVWTAMNDVVAAIRSVESSAGTPPHLIAVQGTGGWSRRLSYYQTHPITAGGGQNIVYEVHVYDPASAFAGLFGNPSATLAVVIGEFGPAAGSMSLADCTAMMDQAEQLEIPYLGWTFHGRCPPNLVVDLSGGGCGVGMPLQPSSWGSLLKARLAQPY